MTQNRRAAGKPLIAMLTMLLLIHVHVCSQYLTGHRAYIFTDASRSNRSVTARIYYPATGTGESAPIAPGEFPVIVFGHGYIIGYDDYTYFSRHMTPLGYIVAFADTESGLLPRHGELGSDLAFLVNRMQSEGLSPSSFFYQHVAPESAIMGHSMGGGASFLACPYNTAPACMVTFAAAETTPSSIEAAQHVTIPALVFSGDADCVTPPSGHQLPIYENLASACKVYISIRGGSHCNFADYNTNCRIAESSCGDMPVLSYAAQQDAVLDLVELYLDYYLRNNSASWASFKDSLLLSPRITSQVFCTATGSSGNAPSLGIGIYPNPASQGFEISTDEKDFEVQVVNIFGNAVLAARNVRWIETSSLQAGIYIVCLKAGNCTLRQKIIVNP